MRNLARYLKNFIPQTVLGPLFKLTEAVFELFIPLVVADIIDNGIARADSAYVLRRGVLMVLLGFTGLLCALVCQYSASRVSQGFGTALRTDLFAHINTLSHAELDRLGAPSLINRLTGDINQLQVAVAMLIRLVVRAPFLVIGSAVMALRIDLRLGCIFLLAAPLVALVLYTVMTRTIPFYKILQRRLDRLTLISRENLTGARVIRAFSRGKTEQTRFCEASADLREDAIRVGKISALLSPLTFTIIHLAIIALLWFGGIRVNTGDISQGEVYALVNYMTQNLLALIVVSNLVVIFTKAAASAARVNEVFETCPSVTDIGSTAVSPVKNAPRIELQNVSFAYSTGEYALENISLSVAAGETLGVIGGTGAGKSTLVNLLPRFYDVTGGAVLVDGVDVRRYPFAELRGQIGMVPQQATLFTGSVRDNLRWGNADADDAALYQALDTAQAREFVDRLPNKLDARISQSGKNLSGGQKQRLAIARALARNPQILILDDSASALDFATDAALRRSLRQSSHGMTVIMVSQRVNTVKHADRILVLDDGHAAGLGTHTELLESCSAYREICLSQLSAEEAAHQ